MEIRTDECVCCAGISERISPKHPLEGSDGGDHERLEEERERGFAARETAIEKADAGDDEPDDEAAEDEICASG